MSWQHLNQPQGWIGVISLSLSLSCLHGYAYCDDVYHKCKPIVSEFISCCSGQLGVMLCYVMLYYVMLCYVMLCYVMLCYVMLCYVMLCYVIYLSIHPSIHLSIGDVLAVAASAVRGWKGVLRFFSMDVRCPPICRQTCLASAR